MAVDVFPREHVFCLAHVSWPCNPRHPFPPRLRTTCGDRPTLCSEGRRGHLSPSPGAGQLVVPTPMAGAQESKWLLNTDTYNWSISAHVYLAEADHLAKPKDKGWAYTPATRPSWRGADAGTVSAWSQWAGGPHGPLRTWVSFITHS